MKCPNCGIAFHDSFVETTVMDDRGSALRDASGFWDVEAEVCPACQKAIILLKNWELAGKPGAAVRKVLDLRVVQPRSSGRPPVPTEVPKPLAEDYKESCLVFQDSPKASAALSRRCLQSMLRDYAKVKHGDLADEIQEVLNSKVLPSHIAEVLDGVRHVGNFAAHPIKSKKTGEVFDVEPGEAEWNLDTLEAMFDFYFVQPARTKARKDALNAKLIEAGKQPMK